MLHLHLISHPVFFFFFLSLIKYVVLLMLGWGLMEYVLQVEGVDHFLQHVNCLQARQGSITKKVIKVSYLVCYSLEFMTAER